MERASSAARPRIGGLTRARAFLALAAVAMWAGCGDKSSSGGASTSVASAALSGSTSAATPSPTATGSSPPSEASETSSPRTNPSAASSGAAVAASGSPSARAPREATPFDGPCPEPRLLLAVRSPAETAAAVDAALFAVGQTPSATLTSGSLGARGRVRVETAEIDAHRFRGVDTNRVAIMVVCADRDTCVAVGDEYTRRDAEARVQPICAPPSELASKPAAVDPDKLRRPAPPR